MATTDPRPAQAVDAATTTHRAESDSVGARVGAMPDTRDVNFYDADRYLQLVLRRRLSRDELRAGEQMLRALGGRVGNELEDLAAEADRNTPQLRVRDKRGEPVNDVVPSAAYRQMERMLYSEYGLAAMALRPGVVAADASSSLVFNDALIYLAAQAESGLFCPLSMTRAMARTLLKFAPRTVVERYVPRLLSTDMDTLYTGAMFMTEKQGGSDLGLVATTARPCAGDDGEYGADGWWELDGDKWFCSNVGADLSLVLARPEGAGPGTRGLGLFLVPKMLPDGTRNSYRIERVKDKLGMRSFASGEVTFHKTRALLIGGPGEGWLQMTEMLNITRLDCACAAAALARRSFVEALVHARGRIAFGAPLANLPLMREQLLDMLLDVEAFTALFFEGSAQLDAADRGDATARVLARVLAPLAKYHVSDEARRVVAEGMEVRGGNSYIEDWPNARLMRDVQVQAIWEGTGNISALDVARALRRDGAAASLFGSLRERMRAQSDPAVGRAAGLVVRALDELERVLGAWAVGPAEERDLRTRRIVRRLAHIVTATILVEDAGVQAREEGSYRCLVQSTRYLRRYLFPPVGSLAVEVDRLPLDAFNAIVDWAPVVPAETAEPLLASMEHEQPRPALSRTAP